MIHSSRRCLGLVLAAAMTYWSPGAAAADTVETTPARVAAGRTVLFEYTLLLPDGFIVETNMGGQAFRYVHGEDGLLPRVVAALEGMAVNEEKSVTLAPADAYGDRDPRALRELPIRSVPYDARLVGAPFAVAGYGWPVLVREVRPETVVLDLNHPLAGQTLIFHLRVLAIDPT